LFDARRHLQQNIPGNIAIEILLPYGISDTGTAGPGNMGPTFPTFPVAVVAASINLRAFLAHRLHHKGFYVLHFRWKTVTNFVKEHKLISNIYFLICGYEKK
jgi:hypothetical protein